MTTSQTADGGCQCGQIRYRLMAEPDDGILGEESQNLESHHV